MLISESEGKRVMVHRQINRRIRLVGICLALVLASAACGGGSEETASPRTGSGSGSGSGEATQVKFGNIGVPIVYGSIMMLVADEEGFLDKYNLDVTFQTFANGADSVRAVIGGGVDAALTATSPTVNVTAKGAKVKGVIGMDKPDYYVASTDPNIKTCEDLKGQTIGVDATGGAKYNSTVTILASCGLKLSDVKLVNFAGPPVIQALAQGQIKVALLHYDEEALVEATSDLNVEEVVSLVKVRPNTHYVMMVATPEYIEKNRDTVIRLTAAYIEAGNFITDPANTDRFVEIASKYTKQPVDVAKQSIELFLDFGFWQQEGAGLTEEKVMGVVQEQLAAGAFTEAEAPAYEDFVDPTIYPEALELVESSS